MNRIIYRCIEHPIWVILITTLLVFAAGYGAQKLEFKSDYRVFFSEENPQMQAFESMQKVYSKSDNVAFILSPQSGKVVTPETLEAIQWLTEASWQIPYSTRVDSISNFQNTTAEEDDLLVEDLYLEGSELSEQRLAYIQTTAVNEPLLLNKVIDAKASVSVVNATLQLPGINPVQEGPEVVTKVRAIRDEFVQLYPDIDVHLSGMVMMNISFAEASQNDSKTLIPMMFGMVVLGIAIMLRTFTGTISTVVVIIYSIVTTMGLAGWMGFFLTGPSSTTPIMVLTLAISDCVHILTTMFYEMRHGMSKKAALIDSLRVNFQPIFLTSITTAIGFLSLNFSDSPPFRDLGNMVAMGVMLAFVFSVTIFPAILTLIPVRIKVHTEESRQKDWMLKLAGFVNRNRGWLLPFMTLAMIGLAVMAPTNKLNDDFVKYFDERVPFRQATDYMQEHLSGMTLLEISVSSGESSGINEPDYLMKLDQFGEWLRGLEQTDHVNILTDTLKRLNKNMHGDDPDWYRLPDTRELAAQYLLLYEMSLPYGLDLNNQLDVDKSSTRVVATFQNLTSKEIIDLENRIKAWHQAHAPELGMEIASPSLMFAHIGQRNIVSMLTGTGSALILISVLLGMAVRSGRYGLVSLIPNLAPAAIGFGIWALMVGTVGLGLSVVAGMTLGIVVDDTIHFLSKYLRARREKQASAEEAVNYAFGSVGRALFITTLVLVAGFMVLAQSSFKVNADMGLMTAITIVIALIVDFFFLPPFLIMLDRHKTEKNQ